MPSNVYSTYTNSSIVNKGLISLLSAHNEFEKQGRQPIDKFPSLSITSDTNHLQLLGSRQAIPRFNGNLINPKSEEIESIDTSKLFDNDYNEMLISEALHDSNPPYSPFQRNMAVSNDIILTNISRFQQTMKNWNQSQFYCEEFHNPYIKSITIPLFTENESFITLLLDGLINLEELTLIFSSNNFVISSFGRIFNEFSNVKLQKLTIICYGQIPISFWSNLSSKIEILSSGGKLYVYSQIDEESINSFINQFSTTVIFGEKILKSSIDFKDLQLILYPIQQFSVTKSILEKGWYRSYEEQKFPPTSVGVSSIFTSDWFNTNQKKELLKYFVDRYPFCWHDCLNNQFEKSLVQYYVHLLNVNQKRLKYFGSDKPNECSSILLDLIIWGYNITICPEIIFKLCTNFGNIGIKLVIDKLKEDSNYINVKKMRALFEDAGINSNAIYFISQLIPFIKNHEQIFDTYEKNDGTKTNALVPIIDQQPFMLVDMIIDKYVTSSNIEGVVEFREQLVSHSILQVALNSDLPNSTILKIVQKNPKLLYHPTSDNQLPITICFCNQKRYELIKPFLEMAPDTLDHEDNNGYKTYHLIPDDYFETPKSVGLYLGIDFFKNHLLPDFAKENLN